MKENQNRDKIAKASLYLQEDQKQLVNIHNVFFNNQKTTLFQVVSYSLYHTTQKASQIKSQCLKHIMLLYQEHVVNYKQNLPKRLEYFYNSKSFLNDFENIELKGNDNERFQIICILFKRRLIIYWISQQGYLSSTIINHGFNQSLEIIRIGGHYYPVIYKDKINNVENCKDINNNLQFIFQQKQELQQAIQDDKQNDIKTVKKQSLSDSSILLNTFKMDHEEMKTLFKYSSHIKNKQQEDQEQYNDLIKEIGKIRKLSSDVKVNFQNQKQKYNHFESIISNLQQNQPKKMTGRLKFFDQGKNYGFIIIDQDNTDIFVHYDDLSKANISRQLLKSAKQGNIIRFQFICMNYIGKYNKSRKAVDLSLLQVQSPYMHMHIPISIYPILHTQIV